VQQERKDQKAYLAHEKRVTHDLIDEFNRTGKFDKSLHMYASEGRLPKSLQHLVRVSKNIPVTIGDMEQQDGLSKNREATSLLKNTSVRCRCLCQMIAMILHIRAQIDCAHCPYYAIWL
jgi:hypothetical protein